MIRAVAVVVISSVSVSFAGSTWSDGRWSAAQTDQASSVTDVSDAIATVVTARAGKSQSRMAAGLSGDWESETSSIITKPIAFSAGPLPITDSADVPHAVAVPLPPATLAAIPGLVVAYLATRRFAKN